MNPIRYLENRIRGWLPKEQSIPINRRTKMVGISEKDRERKAFKISIVANAIILNIFLLAHLLIDPFNMDIEYAVISWIIFVLSLVSFNFLLYRYSKRKPSSQMENALQ
jgi:Flp pilus assembly protein TadB